MYKVTKNSISNEESVSLVSIPDFSSLIDSSNLEKFDWSSKSVTGEINLGPFTVTYELNINTSSPIDSSFQVKIVVHTGLTDITLINAIIDKNHAEVGIDKYGFKAKVLFDINNLELKVILGAFGHTWETTLWKD